MAIDFDPVQDQPKVTPEGSSTQVGYNGMNLRELITHPDERGSLVELMHEGWAYDPEPIAQVYHVTAEPGSVRGWVLHREQADRIAVLSGQLQWAFYDGRSDSPTYKLSCRFTFGAHNRHLFTIPPGVYHAVKNVSAEVGYFVNMPSRAYAHDDPDKHRLPIEGGPLPHPFE